MPVLSPNRSRDVVHRSVRRVALGCAALVGVAACGTPKTFDQAALRVAEPVAATAPAHRPHCGPHHLRACTPAQRRAMHAWFVAVAYAQWLAGLRPVWHYNWDAGAICETGGDWHVVGSFYSTGLGIMNQAIVENSPADVAARELSGTSTVDEIKQTAESIAARHGIESWGCWRVMV